MASPPSFPFWPSLSADSTPPSQETTNQDSRNPNPNPNPIPMPMPTPRRGGQSSPALRRAAKRGLGVAELEQICIQEGLQNNRFPVLNFPPYRPRAFPRPQPQVLAGNPGGFIGNTPESALQNQYPIDRAGAGSRGATMTGSLFPGLRSFQTPLLYACCKKRRVEENPYYEEDFRKSSTFKRARELYEEFEKKRKEGYLVNGFASSSISSAPPAAAAEKVDLELRL